MVKYYIMTDENGNRQLAEELLIVEDTHPG
jgi:hypothetical protein